MRSPSLAVRSPQGTKPHSGATYLEGAWSYAPPGDSSPVSGVPFGSLSLISVWFRHKCSYAFPESGFSFLPRHQGLERVKGETVSLPCLRADLLGMQGQRCPVGVTAAPELRPPDIEDTEPCQHGRCRPGQRGGNFQVYLDHSSKYHINIPVRTFF